MSSSREFIVDFISTRGEVMTLYFLIKAHATKVITVPGYTKADGTVVPPHQKTVHYDPDRSQHDVINGRGNNVQKMAHRKVSKEDHFKRMTPEEQHALILAHATDIHEQRRKADAVSRLKQSVGKGEKPKPGNMKIFHGLTDKEKDSIISDLTAKHGTDHVHSLMGIKPVEPKNEQNEPKSEPKPIQKEPAPIEETPAENPDKKLSDEPKTEPKAAEEPKKSDIVLQNRERNTPQSIMQMTMISANPDYWRMSVSRSFTDGAPIVIEQSKNMALGRKSFAVTAKGERVPVRYAVVDADDLLTSNLADGTPVADYENGKDGKMRAIAGNGRIAGIKAAYDKGTTDDYVRELIEDPDHGVDPEAIKGIKKPVLVRIMPTDRVTQDIGDISNTSGTAALSPLEQAKNDARRIDMSKIEFDEDGISTQNVENFVRKLPVSEQVGLMAPDGGTTRQAHDRMMAAVFATAYESDSLINLYVQARDPDSKNVLNGMAVAAHSMAQLKGKDPYDIRKTVVEAAEAAINARRKGTQLETYAATVDMTRSQEADNIIGMLAQNLRSSRKIGESLSQLASGMLDGYSSQDSMFGSVEPGEVWEHWKG